MTAATTPGYERQARANEAALNLLFHSARTHTAWLPKPVPERLLRAIYDVAKWGPTSSNSSPARFVFLWSDEAKARLLPALMPGNVEKSRTAPVVAIIAYDLEFYEKLPKLFPHVDARSWFVGNLPLIEETAFRNSALQGAYFMLAARSARSGLRANVGVRRGKGQRGVFPGWEIQSQLHLQLGLWRSIQGSPARSPPRLRRGLLGFVTTKQSLLQCKRCWDNGSRRNY